MKYFEVDEAQALIPKLEEIFRTVLEIAPRAQDKSDVVKRLEDGNSPTDLAIEKAQLEFLIGEINEWLQRIVELGALPKGLEPPLVDFPARLGGREVYLCWRLGEKEITHYHGTDEGFSERKKLPRELH
ncbi:MAG: DUF2203 domain-containing protein [Elusimicrobia bacterium]|nr:DUF2203 domain-containing protein [Elusimicrobiota bacterium]